MTKKKKEIYFKPEYVYRGTGFPVHIKNAPFYKVAGEEVLDINLDQLELGIARLLLMKPHLLSGKEIKFLRVLTHHSLREFAEHFNMTPAGIQKWEESENRDYKNDFLIRQIVAEKIGEEYRLKISYLVHKSQLKWGEYQESSPPISIQADQLKKDKIFRAGNSEMI